MGKSPFFPVVLFLSLFAEGLLAQDSLQSRFIDISKITLSESIQKNIGFSYLDSKVPLIESYHSIVFNTGPIHPRQIPEKWVTQKAILRFNLCNSSDSARSVWFFPGLYYWESQLYELEGSSLKKNTFHSSGSSQGDQLPLYYSSCP